MTLPDENRRSVGARELVRIRVVDHDLAVEGQRRQRTVACKANRSRKPHCAVFVGILQPGVDQNGGRAAVETLLEFFFRYARNAHGPYCRCAVSALSTSAGVQPATVRLKGMTRAELGGEGIALLSVFVALGRVIAADSFPVTDQPDERRPQCIQRRKIAPGSHQTPNSWRPER